MHIPRTPPLRRALPPRSIEPLEDRIAPASTVSLLGSGDITVLDGANANDSITISLAGANLHFSDPNGIIAGSNAVQIDANNVEVPASALLGVLLVDTGAEAQDRVTFAAGLPLLNGVLVHTQTLTPLPTLSIGPDGLDLTTSLSPIVINGTINAAGNSVSLQAGANIQTSAAVSVIAGSISANAATGIQLRMDADFINALNGSSGAVTLNELNSIAIGTIDSGAGGLTLQSGTFRMSAGGALAGGHRLTVNGALDLNGTSQSVGALSGTGTIGTTGGATATLEIGVDNQDGTFNGSIGGQLAVVKSGSGLQAFSGPQSYLTLTTNAGTTTLNTPVSGAQIENTGGTLIFNAGAPGSAVNVNATTLFNGGQQIGALNVGDTGFAKMAPHAQGGNPFVLDVQQLTFNFGSGKLDLANNAMIVRSGNLTAITAFIASGFNTSSGGYWDGSGLNSSAAAGDPQQVTALGVFDNNDFAYANFVGVPLSDTGHNVVVRHTLYGDVNLDGVVTGVDYALVDLGLNTPGASGWSKGDFNYDGAITAADLALRDNAAATQVGVPGGVIHQWTGAVSNDWFDPANWTNGVPTATDTAIHGKPGGFQPQLTTTATVAFWVQVTGTFSGSGTLNVSQGMTWLSGTESGGATILAAAASLDLTGSNSRLLDARSLTLPANTITSPLGGLLLDNNAILQAQGNVALSIGLTFLPGNGTIDTNGFDVTTGSSGGNGGLTKIGAGALILGGTSSYQGVTNLIGGTLAVDASNRLSPNTTVTVNGGTLAIGAFDQTVASVALNTGSITGTTGKLQASSSIAINGGTVTADLSSNAINLTNANVNANLDAGAGTIFLASGSWKVRSSYSSASTVQISGGTFGLGPNNVTLGATTIDSGSITATTGKLFAKLTVNGGTVNADVDAGNSTITLNGGIFTPNSGPDTASTLILSGGTFALGTKTASLGGLEFNSGSITGTGTITSASDYLLTGGTLGVKLAGNVGLVKNGPGTAVLANSNNSFTGTVTINDGALQISSNGALGNLANDLVIESTGALVVTGSIASARHVIANGATPTINILAGTVTLSGPVDGTGLLHKTGAGNLVLAGNFTGNTLLSAGAATTKVGTSKVKFTGTGTITLTIVSDGLGGTRISKVELADTDATTLLAISGPRAPSTLTIDTILSLDPNDEIGTIKLGKTVVVGNGVDDAIADVDIHGKVNKLLLNDINSYTLFELGKGLPYNNTGDETTPDSYNNHPDIKLRNVLGPGMTIDVTGNGIAGDQPGSLGGGGLGKVIVNQWDQPGTVKTSQSIGYFGFRHGDCNVVFLVDPDHLGALTTAGIGKMLVPNGAWGSSGSIVEGNVTLFSAAQFLAAANVTAGSMGKLLIKKGPYLGTTTLKNPDAPKMGTFSVNGDYQGYVESAQALSNLNIKGTFKGSIKAKSIGSISAYSFNGTTTGDGEGDPLRHNIFVTDGSLGTIKTSAGGIKDFEIAVATVFNGFSINWPSAPGGAVGINHVNVAAGQINNTAVKLNLGAPNPLSYGIRDSVLESAGSMGNLTSSHSVTGSIFSAVSTIGTVTINADLLGSKLLAGTSLGGDGVFDGDETYTRAGKIGNVTALGTFGTTSIAVGVNPGPGFIYGDGDDVAAAGVATPAALGALTFGAASGGIFGPAGIIHTDAIEAATIKSLKVGASPLLKTFATTHYIRAGGSEAASDVLVRVV